MKEIIRILVFLALVFLFLSSSVGFAVGLLILAGEFLGIKKCRVSRIVNYLTDYFDDSKGRKKFVKP